MSILRRLHVRTPLTIKPAMNLRSIITVIMNPRLPFTCCSRLETKTNRLQPCTGPLARLPEMLVQWVRLLSNLHPSPLGVKQLSQAQEITGFLPVFAASRSLPTQTDL